MKRKANSQGMGPENPRRKQPGTRTQELVNKQPGVGTPKPVETNRISETGAGKHVPRAVFFDFTQWWTRCTQPRTAHFPRRRDREMKSELSEADFERDELHRALKSVET